MNKENIATLDTHVKVSRPQTCGEGFKRSEGETLSCININECESQVCNINAACTDTPGSYRCQCNPGFLGNGKRCEKLDSSSNKTESKETHPCFLCHWNAECIQTNGTFECQCLRRYSGDGYSCVNAGKISKRFLFCSDPFLSSLGGPQLKEEHSSWGRRCR